MMMLFDEIKLITYPHHQYIQYYVTKYLKLIYGHYTICPRLSVALQCRIWPKTLHLRHYIIVNSINVIELVIARDKCAAGKKRRKEKERKKERKTGVVGTRLITCCPAK